MDGTQGAVAPEFELTVEESAEARPLPGFHTTRTRTFFVDNFGQIYLLAAPGHRAMLQRQDELPDDAEPTRDVPDPDLWMMARAAAALGRGDRSCRRSRSRTSMPGARACFTCRRAASSS